MGQWYDVGLQAGKKVAEKIDEFIRNEHKSEKENFDPKKRKTLKDGTTVYQWYKIWQPEWFEDEKRFVKVLKQFEDFDFDGTPEEIDYAFKLVAVGDEGSEDSISNCLGDEYFDGLYNAHCVTYPDGFDDKPSSGKYVVVEAYSWCLSDMKITGPFQSKEKAAESLKKEYQYNVQRHIEAKEKGNFAGSEIKTAYNEDFCWAEIAILSKENDDRINWIVKKLKNKG